MAPNNGYENFHLMLYSDSEIIDEVWLPVFPDGYFNLHSENSRNLLSIFSKDGFWSVKCNARAFFTNVSSVDQSFEVQIKEDQILELSDNDRKYVLYVEKLNDNSKIFHNYSMSNDVELTIGRDMECDIVYNNSYVYSQHAVLYRRLGKWSIENLSGINSVYINGKSFDNTYLKTGDVICIFGLRIIIGPGLISVNDNVENISVNFKKQILLHNAPSKYYGERTINLYDDYFNRMPRKRIANNIEPIIVEGPPVSMSQNKLPLLLRMGSSMFMGGTAAISGNFGPLVTSVMLPFISSKYTDKQRQEYEKLRVTKYTEYLDSKKNEILSACENEIEYLSKKYPTNNEVAKIVDNRIHLWERRVGDSDFLQVRLGTGTRLLTTPIDYPKRKFELETDELEDKMYVLVENEYKLFNAPIILSIADTRVCGILGENNRILEFIKSLILQISTFHSYDEVKLVLLSNEDVLKKSDDIRYLPHFWDNQNTIRFIATNESEVYKVGEHIKNQLENDKSGEKDLTKVLKRRSYYIVFALDKKLLESHEIFSQILEDEEKTGVSIICAYDDLPKESQKLINLDTYDNNICTTLAADGGEDEEFHVDIYDSEKFKGSLRELSNIKLKTEAKENELPKMITFLEMFGVGKIEELNSLKRWSDNDPIKSLAAPVGVGSDGELFMLDLHEKRQGPHGLVAGMTGSGKSEFIITYILSMAVCYHPDEVTFLLIDYKGGGLAGAFDNPKTGVRLPHLVGTITNLDGASIQRSLLCIESELLRRQKLFNDVKAAVNEGTMDIYTYQKLYRAGKVSEPVPHLFIISDEFAELKQQQPEFMDKLISAARIGRSLGVHLILATQKPSGVVNDQIRSNTKFRVCLRVQDRSDSMDMLKRPEAAELTDTGRFYLQVGYNEYFAMGQSAWCGAQYEPQDKVVTRRDDSVEVLDTIGQVIAKAKPKVNKSDSGMKQIVAVVKYLSDISKNADIKAKQLWEPALPSLLDYNKLENDAVPSDESTPVAIGLIDDPKKQKQYPLYLDMQSFHHMLLCGQAGSGKSTFFKTMLFSCVMQYTPEELNYYILDLSGGMLSAFKNMPHCGAYLTSEDEADFDRMLALIKEITDERKKMFADAEVFSYDAYRKINKLPIILVLIDGWTNIGNFAKGQEYSLSISKYMREAANYGIRFIFSVNNYNELSAKVKFELDYKIALQAKDKFDYNDILGVRNAFVPPELSGRGICIIDGESLEYQIAIPYSDFDDQEQMATLKNTLKDRALQLVDCKVAKRLPLMNNELEYEDFCNSFELDRIPLGFSMDKMQPIAIPLQQLYTMGLYFGNPIGVKPIIFNILSAFNREKADVIIVRRKSGTIFDKSTEERVRDIFSENFTILDTNAEELNQLNTMIVDNIVQTKKSFRDEFCVLNGIPETDMGRTQKAAKYIRKNSRPLVVLFESFPDLLKTEIDKELQAEFNTYFGMFKGYNVYFIGCFYPEDDSNSSNVLYRSFVKTDFALLFGGQFQKQWITPISPEFKKMDKVNPNYNRFLMKYRNECYKVFMPCGELVTNYSDPDEEEII